MRILIAGGGDIAFQFARELADKWDTVVVMENPDAAARFDRLDVQVVLENPASAETLRNLDVNEEDDFIACSEADELNIIACLTAKQIFGAHTICFVSKEEYYNSFTLQLGLEHGMMIDRIIWPQYMLAEEIANIVLVPKAIDVEILEGGRIWLQEYRIRAKSPLLDKPVAQLGLHDGVLAVAVARDDDFYVPRGDTVFQEGDKVSFMGTKKALRAVEKRFFRRPVEEKVKNVTIVGGGNVGAILARILEEEGDIQIKIIEKDPERCERLAAELKSTLVLNGDGTDLELLEVEQIYLSDVMVSVTSDDEKDLLCSLLAREMEIPKIITRVSNPGNLHLFESLGIDVPLNPRLTATKTVLASLQDTNVRLLAVTEQGKGNIIELKVPPDYPVTTIKDLAPPVEGAIIAAIVRGHRTLVPHGGDHIEPGDRLLVFATQEATEAAQDFF